jgi:hypothetical protein
MSRHEIAAFNARSAELARERRRRNPEKIRALQRAKYARQKQRRNPDRFSNPDDYSENPGVEVELVL